MQASLRSSYQPQQPYYDYSNLIAEPSSPPPPPAQEACFATATTTAQLHTEELAAGNNQLRHHVQDDPSEPAPHYARPHYAMLLPGAPLGPGREAIGGELGHPDAQSVGQGPAEADAISYAPRSAAAAADFGGYEREQPLGECAAGLYQHQAAGEPALYYQAAADYHLSGQQAELDQQHQVKVIELQESYHPTHPTHVAYETQAAPGDIVPSGPINYHAPEPAAVYGECHFAQAQVEPPHYQNHHHHHHHLQPYGGQLAYNADNYYAPGTGAADEPPPQPDTCYHSLDRMSYYEPPAPHEQLQAHPQPPQHLESAHFYEQQQQQIGYQQLEESRKQHEVSAGHLLIDGQQQQQQQQRQHQACRHAEQPRNSVASSGSSTCSSGASRGSSRVDDDDDEGDDEEGDEEDEEEEEDDDDDEDEERRRAAENEGEEEEHDDEDGDSTMTRDERKAREAGIPLSYHEIVNLSIDQFNEHIARFQYAESQLTLIKDIRRRGKNKVAAQTCRKRKMEQIVELQREVGRLASKRMALSCDLNRLLQEHLKRARDYERLYGAIQAHMAAQSSKLTTRPAAAAATVGESSS